MATDYRKLCIELFGTDNVDELKRISLKHKSGRKRTLDEKDVQKIIKMQQQGIAMKEIAEHFGVSRQTISKYLNAFPQGNYTMRINFMLRQKVCTEIYVDFLNEKISIINRTNDVLSRAFGVIEKPTWEDFEYFLKERCISENRGDKKDFLKALGVDHFDPLQIIEATKGRMAEDNYYINFVYKGRC